MIGKVYALDNLGNHAEAVVYYDKALATNPRYIPALTEKGYFLDKIGNYNLAIVYFDKALAIALNNAGAETGKKRSLANN